MSSIVTIDQIMNGLLDNVSVPHKHKEVRNKAIFRDFHGMNGGSGTTLEEQGTVHGGLTRECVRQVVNNVRAQFFLGTEEKAAVSKALDIMRASTPCEVTVIAEALHEKGLLSTSIDQPQGLLELCAQVMKEKSGHRFPEVGGRVFAVKKGGPDLIKRIRSEANKVVSSFGMVSVSGLKVRIEELSGRQDADFIRSVISSHEDFQFITDEWIAGSEIEDSCLARRVGTAFSVYKSVPMDVMYRVSARSLRQIKVPEGSTPEFKAFGSSSLDDLNKDREKKGLKPILRRPSVREQDMKMAFPQSVFECYLAAMPGIAVTKVDGKPYAFRSDSRKPAESSASDIEKLLLKAIRDSGKTELQEHEILKAANFSKKQWYSFMMACNFSPVISRVSRGQYRLLGQVDFV